MLKLCSSIFKPFCSQYELITQQYMNSRKGSYMERTFVDRVKIKVQGGNGGNGCVSHFRSRIVKTGAPDGGNGGDGGDIYVTTNKFIYDLSRFRKPEIQSNNGKSGHSGKSDGKKGGDIHLQVPVGTLVYEVLNQIQDKNTFINEQGESQQVEKPFKYKQYNKKLLADLSQLDQTQLIVRGGHGGKGNGKNINIKKVDIGKIGNIKEILLELKLIADIGLVGFPNVGKSTLLASVCRSLPKIDNYMFTTLTPSIGKVDFIDNSSFTIADIPGIIEDAHKNKGLGISFLRHIERTKVLIFVLDANDQDIIHTYKILNNELMEFRKDFNDRPRLVVLNKCDLNPQIDKISRDFEIETGIKPFTISAKHGFKIGELLMELKKIISIMNESERKKLLTDIENEKQEQIKRILLDKEFFEKS